jgi:hypothetical protein
MANGDIARGTIFREERRNYISGFEGSQAVPACPSFRFNAYTVYDRN